MANPETACSIFCGNFEGGISPPSRNSPGTVRGKPNSPGDREPSVILGNRLEAKDNQRKVKKPVRASQASTECSLERSVDLFNHTITLRVETGGS